MKTAADFYQKLWPLIKSKPAIYSLKYMRARCFLLKSFPDNGIEPETARFEGILSPHTEDLNSFYSISNRRLERGGIEEMHPVIWYTEPVDL